MVLFVCYGRPRDLMKEVEAQQILYLLISVILLRCKHKHWTRATYVVCVMGALIVTPLHYDQLYYQF